MTTKYYFWSATKMTQASHVTSPKRTSKGTLRKKATPSAENKGTPSKREIHPKGSPLKKGTSNTLQKRNPRGTPSKRNPRGLPTKKRAGGTPLKKETPHKERPLKKRNPWKRNPLKKGTSAPLPLSVRDGASALHPFASGTA